jgi:NAD-dependent SIR2 family protein deacetylase
MKPKKSKIRRKQKTIYFLGAGFSAAAGAPSQSALMGLIHDFNVDEYVNQYQGIYSAQLNNILPRQHREVRNFIGKLMSESPNIDLEDIYTPIDRSIISGVSFKGLSPEKLRSIRESLNALIGIIIDKSFNRGDTNYVRDFAQFIVQSNRNAASGDKAVIFTTNWDIVLDNAIDNLCFGRNGLDAVDYCCHYTNYNRGENMIPPLIVKERGNHTHKILKLNGSLNWLKCTGCGRIQVSFHEKVALKHYYDITQCRFCGTTHMEPEMLMPTFLKNNNNTQLKNVWDQAGIELFEAEKVVFMGYSLPMADFEIRQHLSRFLDRNVEIEVVLTRSSNPSEYDGLEQDIREKILYELPSSRYQRFFAKNNPIFYYDGVVNYINDLTQ